MTETAIKKDKRKKDPNGPRIRRVRRKAIGLSMRDAAKALGVSDGNFTAMVEAKQIQVLTLGTLQRVPLSEIERLKAIFLGTAAAE